MLQVDNNEVVAIEALLGLQADGLAPASSIGNIRSVVGADIDL